jgi:membrane protein
MSAGGEPGGRLAGVRARLSGAGGGRVADLAVRARSSLPARCLASFTAINGRDRALVLGGQAFTTIIPLLILAAAGTNRHGSTAVADRLARRFHVTGSSALAFRTLFERPPGTAGAITIVSLVVLLFSLLSLTRSLQRTYEAAWRLPAMGVRGTLNGLSATGLLVASVLVLSLLSGALRHLPAGTLLAFLLRIVAAAAIWLVLQSLLLSRRIPLRRLLAGSAVAGIGQAAVSVSSAVWMPRLIEHNTARYGIIGLTFAIVTWLIVVCFGLVLAAVFSAEIGGADDGAVSADV